MAKKTKKQTRTKQARGLKTHEKLIHGGIEILRESSISGLRFSKLSQLVQVPQSLIDYHFPSMEALQMAMIQYKIKQLLDFTIESIEKAKAKPRAAFEIYLKVPFVFAKKDKDFSPLWTAYYHFITTSQSFKVYNDVLLKNGQNRIENLVRGIIVSEGLKLKSNQSIEKLAQQIQGIIIGYLSMATATNTISSATWQKYTIESSSFLLDNIVED